MNLIELHILQSFPVTCLNRDDLGAPKSARFGGVERARVSSQCWKRAVRELAHETAREFSMTSRTKYLKNMFVDELHRQDTSITDADADSVAAMILSVANKDKKLFGKVNSKKDDAVDTLFYISNECIRNIVAYVLERIAADAKFKPSFKEISDIIGGQISDAADIALFGRMVAADATNTVEGAALFSHALSTHAVRSELDFFSAVDDEKKNGEDAGAGQIGTIEYNSACYYRYVGVNIDLLKEEKQRKLFDQSQIRTVLDNFIRAAVLANPAARKNSMFGQSLPSYVLAVKRSGQPISLANAFEKAIPPTKDGFIAPSISAIKKEWAALKAAFGIGGEIECEIEKGKAEAASLEDVLEKLLENLH